MTLQDIVEKTLAVEGGYTYNPNDSGGETNFGITLATARRYGYTGPMRHMSRLDAVRIYIEVFLKDTGIDKISVINPSVCEEVYDTAVNCGPGVAIEFLQRALNVLNRGGKDYADLTVDGSIGPKTLATLQSFLRLRKQKGQEVLLKILNALQGARYVQLAERRVKDETFIFGWFDDRINLA